MTPFYRILNTLSLVAVLVTNYLANALPINGFTTGELSDLYPNLFVPAGITFSIWGVIYFLLLCFIIYQWTSHGESLVSSFKFYFFISCLLNVGWIFLWHFQLVPFSVVVMFALLITVITLYKLSRRDDRKWHEALCVTAPFSVYLGWISVATIANVTTLFIDLDLHPVYPAIWAVIMIMITQILVFGANRQKADLMYSLTIVWALAGIVLKQLQENGPQIIIYACYASVGITALLYFSFLIKQRNRVNQ